MSLLQIASLLCACLLLTGCSFDAPSQRNTDHTPLPSAEPPMLDVYIKEENVILRMDVESYVAGVVAGEMPNDWPMEALKAQAILARTYVLKFLTEKTSRYSGADISTDIAEAQAYDADAINARILTAVQETSGEILLASDGSLPYTWFHAHSGGTTALAREALDWQQVEPTHTKVTDGLDSDAAPLSAREWQAEFSASAFLAACRETGASVSTCQEVRIETTGPSGRAVLLWVDGVTVNAARLRISLGSTRMRSTLLTELDCKGGVIRMAGRGYGHGVGMPQWGAFALAEDGLTGEDIALHYYNDLSIVRVW